MVYRQVPLFFDRVIAVTSAMNDKTKFKRRDGSNIIRFYDVVSRYCCIAFSIMRVIKKRGRDENFEIDNSVAARIITITVAQKKGSR